MKATLIRLRDAVEEALFLDAADEAAKKLASTEAAALARRALTRLALADDLAGAASTRASAWPVLRDARHLAVAARAAAGKEPLEPAPIDASLDDDDLSLDAKKAVEARELLDAGSDRARALLAGVEPRTPREITWERRIRLFTLAIAVALSVSGIYSFARAPRNLTRGATVKSGVVPGQKVNPLVNGIIEEKTWSLTGRDKQPTVLVDLGAKHTVRRIIVYGRGDRERTDFLPLVVEVSEDGQGFMEIGRRDTLFTAYVPWIIDRGVKNVRYVRLYTPDRGEIALAELEVWGY